MANKLFSDLAKGTYDNGTAYTVGDFVDYNGSSYACIVNTTGNLPTDTSKWALLASKGATGSTGATGATGPTGPTGPAGTSFTWLDAYDNGTAYVANDVVSYNGSSYICILASTGNVPTNATYWSLVAQKGTDGAGSGTVTSVSVTTANGVSGSVATATTTPAITLTLGAITPSGVQVSGLTASEIVITDASKNLVSAAVATYPSLTELSYVKGVTSAVQTQINALPTASSTTTFSNKRINPRVVTTADDSTAVIDVDVTDQYQLTAMANATTISTTGTPVAGQKLTIRLKDDGTARALTWDGVFRAVGVTLPTTTVISKTHYIGCIYNFTDTKWDAVAVVAQA